MPRSIFVLVTLFFLAASAASAPKPTKPLKAGQNFKDCATCPVMVVIPGGEYTMGAAPDEPGYFEIEGPQHKVKVKRFALGKFDITKAQWEDFAKDTHRKPIPGCYWTGRTKGMEADPQGSWQDTGFTQVDSSPVVCISWTEIQEYLQWLGKKTGRTYRLPSEAEWEYAARAGSQTLYSWGNTPSHDLANYGGEKCCGGLKQGKDQWDYTSPVGSFPPNKFGLYDMHGNVLQYLQDCLALSYAETPIDGSAYQRNVTLQATGELAEMVNNKQSCSMRICRGGDWADPPSQIRAGFRSFAPGPGESLEAYRSAGVGFRVAASIE